MKKVYTINDIENGMYLAYLDEDGTIRKEGSMLVTYTNVETEKIYGRGYRKREPYGIGFHITSFYNPEYKDDSNRVLLTAKEFKKGFVGDSSNKFNAKSYIKEELIKAGFEFTKIRFTKKLIYERAWQDVRNNKYPAVYIMALYIEGHDYSRDNREDNRKRWKFRDELEKKLQKEFCNVYKLEIGWDNKIFTRA